MPERIYREDTEPTVVEKEFHIKNRQGLHARPASMMAKLTARFDSDIYLKVGVDEINGKSIMGIITLAAAQGSALKVKAIGKDAPEAIEAIGELIESKFGED